MWCREGDEYILFLNQTEPLRINQVLGGTDDDFIKQVQLRKTIEEHLDRELQLSHLGIKVLSLFFIDRVANYREYDSDGNAVKGKYARWFEEGAMGRKRTGPSPTSSSLMAVLGRCMRPFP